MADNRSKNKFHTADISTLASASATLQNSTAQRRQSAMTAGKVDATRRLSQVGRGDIEDRLRGGDCYAMGGAGEFRGSQLRGSTTKRRSSLCTFGHDGVARTAGSRRLSHAFESTAHGSDIGALLSNLATQRSTAVSCSGQTSQRLDIRQITLAQAEVDKMVQAPPSGAGKCLGFCLRQVYSPESKHLKDHYTLGEILGKGSFGTVYAAKLNKRAQMNMSLKSQGGGASMDGASTDAARLRGQTAQKQVKAYLNKVEKSDLPSIMKWLRESSESPESKNAASTLSYPFACKVLFQTPGDEEAKATVVAEVRMLEVCTHPYVLLQVEYLQSKLCHYIVTQRCYGSALSRLTSNYEADPNLQCDPEEFIETRRKWIFQMIKAVEHVHSIGIVHRDLKPENLFCTTPLSDPDIVLGDFGLSVEDSSRDLVKRTCGTKYFFSPELLQNGRSSKSKSAKVTPQSNSSDVWAIGMSAYQLAVGDFPYNDFFAHMMEKLEVPDYDDGSELDIGEIVAGWFVDLGDMMMSGSFEIDFAPLEDLGFVELAEKTLAVKGSDRPSCKQLLKTCFCDIDKANYEILWGDDNDLLGLSAKLARSSKPKGEGEMSRSTA